jgi:tetratricopeptide (TPR) repeat protein
VSEHDHGATEPAPDDGDAASAESGGSGESGDLGAASGNERETAYELLQRGQDLLAQRHFAQAAVVLERADREEPAKASILEALGRAYYNSGQHDRSRATFEQLLEIDPSAHYAHFALGQSLKQLGRPDAARTHLRLALAMSPASKLYAGALARLGPPDPRTHPRSDEADDDAEERPDASATGD